MFTRHFRKWGLEKNSTFNIL